MPAVIPVISFTVGTNEGVQDFLVPLLPCCSPLPFLFPVSTDFGPWLSRMHLFFL